MRWLGRAPLPRPCRLDPEPHPTPSAPGTATRVQAAACTWDPSGSRGQKRPGLWDAGQSRPPGPFQPAEAREGVTAPAGRRAGRPAPHQQPPLGALRSLLGSVSPHLAGPRAAPALGVVGSCYSVPTPWGTEPYTSLSGPQPGLPSHPIVSTSGKAALYTPTCLFPSIPASPS